MALLITAVLICQDPETRLFTADQLEKFEKNLEALMGEFEIWVPVDKEVFRVKLDCKHIEAKKI